MREHPQDDLMRDFADSYFGSLVQTMLEHHHERV